MRRTVRLVECGRVRRELFDRDAVVGFGLLRAKLSLSSLLRVRELTLICSISSWVQTMLMARPGRAYPLAAEHETRWTSVRVSKVAWIRRRAHAHSSTVAGWSKLTTSGTW